MRGKMTPMGGHGGGESGFSSPFEPNNPALPVVRRTVWWIVIGAVAVLIAIVLFWKKGNGAGVAYRKVAVERGDLRTTILSTGIVQPENRLEIKSPIAGRAEEILVDEGQLVKKGRILLWMSSTERAALLDAARARGGAELKRWEDFYKPTPVMAPIDGTIILRNIEPGQTFTTQDSVMVMSDRLTIQAQVDETDIAQIRLEQEAAFVLDAYPGEKSPAHVKKIAYDSKTVNNVTTYIVDVLPDGSPSFMKSGMTANVTFVAGAKSGVLILPTEVVKSREGHAFVLLDSKDKHGSQTEREIETGLTDGKRVEVVSGLSDGEIVMVPQMKAKGGAKPGGSSPFSPMGRPGRAH